MMRQVKLPSLVVVASLLLFLAPSVIHALPSGAANCAGGRAAVGVTHMQGSVTEGTLEKGGIQVSIGDTLLVAGEVVQIPANRDLSWNLNATKRPLRGFLIRAEDSAGKADTTLALSAQDEDAQVAHTVCLNAFNVGGVTHTNNNQKRTIAGHFRLDEVVDALQLDVTIVIKNRNGNSVYYYSGYTVQVVKDVMEGDTLNEGVVEEDSSTTTEDMDDEEESTTDNNEDSETTEEVQVEEDEDLPLILRAVQCADDNKCGRCEGDCNKNSHCEDGLECFYRPDTTGTLTLCSSFHTSPCYLYDHSFTHSLFPF